jgi:hypothetical protein
MYVCGATLCVFLPFYISPRVLLISWSKLSCLSNVGLKFEHGTRVLRILHMGRWCLKWASLLAYWDIPHYCLSIGLHTCMPSQQKRPCWCMHGIKAMQVMHALIYLTQESALTHRWVHIMLPPPAANNLQGISMALLYSMVVDIYRNKWSQLLNSAWRLARQSEPPFSSIASGRRLLPLLYLTYGSCRLALPRCGWRWCTLVTSIPFLFGTSPLRRSPVVALTDTSTLPSFLHNPTSEDPVASLLDWHTTCQGPRRRLHLCWLRVCSVVQSSMELAMNADDGAQGEEGVAL